MYIKLWIENFKGQFFGSIGINGRLILKETIK
jgi:hypothetical protein